MTGIAGLFTPLLAHMLVLQLVALVCSSWMDAASMTTLAALILCLPMYRQVKKEGPQSKIKNIPSLLIPFVLGVAGNLLGSWLMDAAGMYDNFSNASQEALYDSSLWIQIAGLGILVPITEELIFRGLIERRASKRWGRSGNLFECGFVFRLPWEYDPNGLCISDGASVGMELLEMGQSDSADPAPCGRQSLRSCDAVSASLRTVGLFGNVVHALA